MTEGKLPRLAYKIGAMRGWHRFLCALLTGIGLAGVQAPVNFFPAFFLALPVAIWLLAGAETPGKASFIGWTVGLGYFGAGLHWIIEPFLVDITRHGALAPLALVGMGGGLALFWAAAFRIASYFRGRLHLVIGFAAALTLAEMARSYVLTGFPWNLLAYGWLETPIAQISAFTGPHGLGFVTLLACGFLAVSWPRWPVWISALSLAGAWIYGSVIIPQTPAMHAAGLTVRLVQPNAPQATKWTAEGMRAQYIRGLEATFAEGDYDIVIWPEASVPQLVGEPGRQWGGADYRWSDISQASQNRPAIIGARRLELGEKAKSYNTLAVVEGGSVTAHYDKHHLVPFGEYIPLARYLPDLGLNGLAASLSNLAGGMTAGENVQVMSVEGIPPFLPMICYEAIFPHQLAEARNGAEWLVHLTNDAWFGILAGPYQHLAQARFRAIEQRLPVARAANTGVSAMIDPWGQITQALPLNTAGFADARLPAAGPAALYSRTGDLPYFLGMGLILGILTRAKART